MMQITDFQSKYEVNNPSNRFDLREKINVELCV